MTQTLTKAARNAAKTKGKKVDYAGAVSLLNRQDAATRRLKNPQLSFNGHSCYGRQLDIMMARSTPAWNARREIKWAYGVYRRAQSTIKDEYASPQMKERMKRELPVLRKSVVKAVRTARAFNPENLSETKRRFQSRCRR